MDDFLERARANVDAQLDEIERTASSESLLETAGYARELAEREDLLHVQRRVCVEVAERFEAAASKRRDV